MMFDEHNRIAMKLRSLLSSGGIASRLSLRQPESPHTIVQIDRLQHPVRGRRTVAYRHWSVGI